MLRRLAFLVVVPILVSAPQDAARPHLEGSILETGTGLPIADASVTISAVVSGREIPGGERYDVVGTTMTDAHGTFRFVPEEFGRYRACARKDGWSLDGLRETVACSVVSLDRDHSRREIRFRFMRPGSISGRVIDAETGEPDRRTAAPGPTGRLRRGQAIAAGGTKLVRIHPMDRKPLPFQCRLRNFVALSPALRSCRRNADIAHKNEPQRA